MKKNHSQQDFINEFPILKNAALAQENPLIFLDSAASSLKPSCMIDQLTSYYQTNGVNIHRGVYPLSEWGTTQYELTRVKVKEFINAASEQEIIITKGTTEAINLVARTYGEHFLKSGDEIIIGYQEHHSNIVPWQILAEKNNLSLKIIPINDQGELILEMLPKLISDKTKIVSLTYISNTLGIVNPIAEIISSVRTASSAIILIDAAQAIAHFPIDVQKIDADFIAFSAHKMFGPFGVGILYGKKELLDKMPPFLGGGDMIDQVTFNKTTYNELPFKFEAGTPSIADVIAFRYSIELIEKYGFENLHDWENQAMKKLMDIFQEFPEFKILGPANNRVSLISFYHTKIHAHDMGIYLGEKNICVRTGHHCTQELLRFFKVPALTRISLGPYTTASELEMLKNHLIKMKSFFLN